MPNFDRDTVTLLKGMRDVIGDVMSKQDVYDKRLKEIEDNFHNQSPQIHYATPDISYGSAGKNMDRKDMEVADEKPAEVSTVAKSVEAFNKHDEGYNGNDFGGGSEPDGDEAGGAAGGSAPDESFGSGSMKDMPAGNDAHEQELMHLREMLKDVMGLVKAQSAREDVLMKKLESITKSQEAADAPALPSNLPIRKSSPVDFETPARGGYQSPDSLVAAFDDFNGLVGQLTEHAVNKSTGEISEAVLARINKMRLQLGDIETPQTAMYDSGIPGMTY